jgi:hypothetical protein
MRLILISLLLIFFSIPVKALASEAYRQKSWKLACALYIVLIVMSIGAWIGLGVGLVLMFW